VSYIKCDCCGKEIYICKACKIEAEGNIEEVPTKASSPKSNIITKVKGPKYTQVRSTRVTAEMGKLIKKIRDERNISWYLAKKVAMDQMGIQSKNQKFHLNKPFREGKVIKEIEPPEE
jgi:hypothetical protein